MKFFLRDGSIKSSIGSGGRYDNAIGGMIESDANFATVGISFGLDVIYTAFELAGKAEVVADVDVYIIPMGTEKEALRLAAALRMKGQRVEVELSGKKLRKAMDKANRDQVKQVIVLGEQEIVEQKYAIKNMETGESEDVLFHFK